MAKKIQLQDANGNVLHPLTLGECVAMNNGENLDTLMSKSQMFTPTITQDKSMFKVGTGVDVDYSANVKDGAYESLVFKGKSLVNLFDKSKVSPDHTSYTLGSDNTITYVANNGFTDGVKLNHLKPNTKYALFFDVLTVPQEPNIPYRINDDGTNYNINIFGTGQDNPTSGFHSFTTGNDVSDLKFFFYTNLRNVGFKLTLPVIIEYQEGMENWDIPYFDGIGYAKMPILHNANKKIYSTTYVLGNLSGTDGTEISHGNMRRTDYIDISSSRGREIAVSCNGGFELLIEKVMLYDKNKNYLRKAIPSELNTSPATFTVPSDSQYCRFTFCKRNYAEMTDADFESIKIVIEEGSAEDSKKPYKTNILRTSEEIVLREVDGVQDTYNPLTGEYVKRIGEVVLDGSEGWGQSGFTNDNYFVAYCQATTNSAKANSKIKCDKIQYDSRVSVIDTVCEGINIIGDKSLRISMSKSRVSNLSDFTSWLQLNPVTIQYELAEPVTTIVKPSTMTPFAYQNGHVIVESGHEGQSLLPEIEYSVVTGRTGQVTQNTKVLRKQEQQIIGLEELLLTQVVQMEYERTLLQFDYELQMMMLG